MTQHAENTTTSLSSVPVLLWPPAETCDPGRPRIDLLQYMLDPKKPVPVEGSDYYQVVELTNDRIFLGERYGDLERETQDAVRRDLQTCFAEQGCPRSISVKEWAKQTSERQTPRLRLRCTKVCGFGFQVNFDMERKQYYLVRSKGKSGNFSHKCPAPANGVVMTPPVAVAPSSSSTPPPADMVTTTTTQGAAAGAPMDSIILPQPVADGIAEGMSETQSSFAVPGSIPTQIHTSLPVPEQQQHHHYDMQHDMEQHHYDMQHHVTDQPPPPPDGLDDFPLMIPSPVPQQQQQHSQAHHDNHHTEPAVTEAFQAPLHEVSYQQFQQQTQPHAHQPFETSQHHQQQQSQQQQFEHPPQQQVFSSPAAEVAQPVAVGSHHQQQQQNQQQHPNPHVYQFQHDAQAQIAQEIHDTMMMDTSSVDSTDMMIARHFGIASNNSSNERVASGSGGSNAALLSRTQIMNDTEHPTVNSMRSFLSVMTGSVNSTMGKGWLGRNTSGAHHHDEQPQPYAATSSDRRGGKQPANSSTAYAAATGGDPMDTVNSAMSALSFAGMQSGTLGTTHEETASNGSGNSATAANPFSADFWSPPSSQEQEHGQQP